MMKKLLAFILAAALALSLAACGAAPRRHTMWEPELERPIASEPDDDDDEETWEPAPARPVPSEPEPVVPTREPVESSPVVETPEPDMPSVAAVARLAGLTGTGELDRYEKHDLVDVNDSHNPYDLVWQYGDMDTEGEDGFGTLYASYVDAADWSLVFDAEYYKRAFPMLAKLYNQDDALLLEHFQTVGVHEGRQGSTGFNVSVYIANCDDDLLDTFGDAYECYYFYYMLNYAAERRVETAGTYGEDPLWLSLELTLAQAEELTSVNQYRAEVGVEPIELDPENIAYANYRAWYNAVNSVRGHGWLDDDLEFHAVCNLLGVHYLSENTQTFSGNATRNKTLMPYATSYKGSESHYKAMINENYLYLGVSHMYYNDDTNWMTQFDTFLRTKPVPDHTMH